jgi:osmotically-inducible protein OsmY
MKTPRLAMLATVLTAVTLLPACAPLLIGGAAVGSALVFTDRRTSGAQVEDQAIELKAESRAKATIGDRGHINVTSYNRTALITGEVASEADLATLAQTVAAVENVKSVVNEAAVMGASSLTARSNDLILGSKVKATFVDTADMQAQSIKVVVERGVVYLMGRVTEREATRAADIARTVSGVQKVVRVFEVISEAELQALQPKK